MSEEHCPHCGCESYDDDNTCAERIEELEGDLKWAEELNDRRLQDVRNRDKRIEELKSELASYMESDANLRERVKELERAFNTYGWHRTFCPQYDEGYDDCTCGYDKALEACTSRGT